MEKANLLISLSKCACQQGRGGERFGENDDHVVTYAATVLYPKLLLFILGNINTMVVVVYQVEPDISVDLTATLEGDERVSLAKRREREETHHGIACNFN
jgi:hypothetical protein